MKRILILLAILLAACAPGHAGLQSQDTGKNFAVIVTTPIVPSPVSEEMAKQAPQPSLTQPVPAATLTEQPAGDNPSSSAKQKEKAKPLVPTPITGDFLAPEIMGRPTDTSITINVIPSASMEISCEYGLAPGAYTAKTTPQSAASGIPTEILVDGLQPDTRYYYRLHYANSLGQEHSFMTQRAPGSSFTFAVQGDSHPERAGKQFDPDLYTLTLQNAAASQPDFFFAMGDDFSVDNLKQVNPQTIRTIYLNQRQWLGLVGAPVFLVNGNHEQGSLANLDGTSENVAVWVQTTRNAYYPQPAPDDFYTGDTEPVEHIGLLRDYYAFTWGDALFVVIDPYWHSLDTVDNQFGAGRSQKSKRNLWNVTLGETQYQWLKQTLETSTAKHKFVFAHHVNGTGRGGIELAGSYEWGDAQQLATYRPGWAATIHQLFKDNGVTIFFQGHDHIFARQELDGVIYQTLPEPANPNYSYENRDAYKSGDILPNSGYLRVTVSLADVRVEYIRSYLDKPAEIAFTYIIP